MNNMIRIVSSRFYFFLILFLGSTCAFSQREIWDVKLNSDKTTEEKEFDICCVKCKINDRFKSDAPSSMITIEIENKLEEHYLLMFNRNISESEAKEQKPSIRFDKKTYGGTYRTIERCSRLTQRIDIWPRGSERLDFTLNNGEVDSIKLVFYIAKKERKGFLFFSKNVFNIYERRTITIPLVADIDNPEYKALYEDYLKLKEEIDNTTFCKNPKHRPGLKEQAKLFLSKRDELDKRIENRYDACYKTNYELSEKYKNLRKVISNLDSYIESIAKTDCGSSHVYTSPHSCKYCNLSLQQIYNKLDDYYIRMYNSNDRKKVKSEIIYDVNLLYKCCIDKRCRNHANSWKTSEFAPKITDRYQWINSY